MIIHFLGGIHELYFPYVLMKPLTLICDDCWGMTGTWVFHLLDGGWLQDRARDQYSPIWH